MRVRSRLFGAILAVLLVLPMALWQWDFMVDDALISARYAANLAAGHGYRFSVDGPMSDGVTPFGWAFVLWPFAHGGALEAFYAAKVLGLIAWLMGAASLGWVVAACGTTRRRWLALLLLATSAPLGAWSVAGMETGVVLGFAACALSLCMLGWRRSGLLLAGLVGAWRPEAIVWAVGLGFVPGLDASAAEKEEGPEQRLQRWRKHAATLPFTLGPFLLVLLLRHEIFGHALPLSAFAKAPVLRLGAMYALAAFVLSGPPALLSVWRRQRLPPWVRGLQWLVLAHFGAIAFAGGDWMPLARLAVVVLPCVCVAAAGLLEHSAWTMGTGRLAIALAAQLFVVIKVAPRTAGQWPKRLAVIEQLREPLAEARVVASLDVGWVGASCGATLVDLAGVTDRQIAALPGGHTSKRIPRGLIHSRNVDTLVLLLAKDSPVAEPWTQSRFARWVEYRVARQPGIGREFRVVRVSEGPLRYVVARRVRGAL